MMGHALNLQLKGDRSYLHGTDLYNTALMWLASEGGCQDICDIDIAFHRLATHEVLISLDCESVQAGEAIAVCTFTDAMGRRRAYLSETAAPVVDSYVYPEDEVIAGARFNLQEKRVYLSVSPPYSDIEVWVALTKALHQRVYKGIGGKWLFVRGKFPRYIRERQAGERELAIVSNFQNKLTRSEAFVDGKKVGEIYFSLTEGKPYAGD